MRYSLQWLREIIDLSVSVEEVMERLTLAGAEVENVHAKGWPSPLVVVAQILESRSHPNADRLRICRVHDGTGVRQIVCGARNYRDGDKAPLALPGAELPGGIKIKKGNMRGEDSEGMLCSARELNLADDAEGLLLLPSDAPIGRPLHEYAPGDTIFELEITPNRPDLLSYRGLARELAAIGCGSLRLHTSVPISWPEESSHWVVDLADPDGCPFYAATFVRGVKVGLSPVWLREKVEAMGHKSINNVVDITNFVLWETGQPLHAFDAARLAPTPFNVHRQPITRAQRMILVRRAQRGEKFAALDGNTYRLDEHDLVITDAHEIVALAGVMGGGPSSVTEATSDLLLESAWFAPQSVRRTSRRLGMISDSSYRFERGVDGAGVLPARDRALALILEICGGAIAGGPRVTGKAPAHPNDLVLQPKTVKRILGIDIPPDRSRHWLEGLGMTVEMEASGAFRVTTPTYRQDLEREIDLVEEIARLHGLDGVPSTTQTSATPESDADIAFDRLSELRKFLAARGWDECMTDVLAPASWANDSRAVRLANPLNEQYSHLRPNLRASLLGVAARNLSREAASLRLFEIDKVFLKDAGRVQETLRLALLVSGQGNEEAWWQSPRATDLADVKGTLDVLETRFGLRSPPGILQAIPRSVLREEHGIKAPVFYAELDLEEWLRTAPARPLFRPLPQFPSVRRDLAVVVDQATSHGAILDVIRQAAVPELEGVQLFDFFTDPSGTKLPAAKKSLAYALTYRATDRTLTEKEVNAWVEQTRKKLSLSLGCGFRDS
jgi:phenylalanyl-tRNA synthetase beta chain